MKTAKTFTISSDIMEQISKTKGQASTSERVNELLRRALNSEQRERLEQEAQAFFANRDESASAEREAFQKAALKTLSRD